MSESVMSPELVERVEGCMPQFVNACENHNRIVLTFGAFIGDPDLCMDALRYAYWRGVEVIFAPNAESAAERRV